MRAPYVRSRGARSCRTAVVRRFRLLVLLHVLPREPHGSRRRLPASHALRRGQSDSPTHNCCSAVRRHQRGFRTRSRQLMVCCLIMILNVSFSWRRPTTTLPAPAFACSCVTGMRLAAPRRARAKERQQASRPQCARGRNVSQHMSTYAHIMNHLYPFETVPWLNVMKFFRPRT